MRPLPSKSRREIAELRDFDLQLALEGARALREDIENQLTAIDDAKVEFLLEVAGLRGAEGVIENRERRAMLLSELADLGGLALTDKGARVGRLEALANDIGDFSTGGFGQRFEFGNRVLGGNFVFGSELDSDQDRAFDLFERLAMRTAQKITSLQLVGCEASVSKITHALDAAISTLLTRYLFAEFVSRAFMRFHISARTTPNTTITTHPRSASSI